MISEENSIIYTTPHGRKITLTKKEDGNIYDFDGNKYFIKKDKWISDYSSLYSNNNEDRIAFWHELPSNVQNFFKDEKLEETFLDSEFDNDQEDTPVQEVFDDQEDDYLGGDFDEFEFHTSAKDAAMNDIMNSGEDFVDLGDSEYEKGMNTRDFVDDLNRTNLRLPSDEKEVDNIQKMMDKRKVHHNKFGVGSLNEEEFKQRLSKIIINKLKNLNK